MIRDLRSNVLFKESLPAAAVTTAVAGTGVDTLGFESCVAILDLGTQAGTSSTFNLQESDDDVDGNYANVAAGDLQGSQPGAITTANDAALLTVGYIGSKRWLRWKLTAASSGNIPVCGIIALGNPRSAPVANT